MIPVTILKSREQTIIYVRGYLDALFQYAWQMGGALYVGRRGIGKTAGRCKLWRDAKAQVLKEAELTEDDVLPAAATERETDGKARPSSEKVPGE